MPDDAAVIQILYHDLLNRDVDAGGLAAWLGVFQSGADGRLAVVDGILGSAEYDGRVVGALYQRFLGRSLDQGGLGYVGALQSGVIREQVMASILASSEYLANRGGGTNLGFLKALYQDVLRRDLDGVGQAQFSALLASGVSRADIALMLLQSRESREMLIGTLYQQLLLRTVDAGGRDGWIGLLERGGTVEDVIAAIVASDEYYNLDRNGRSIGDLLVDPFGGGVTVTSSTSSLYTTTLSDPTLDTGLTLLTGWSTGDGYGTYGQGGDTGSSPPAVPQPQPIGLIVSGLALLAACAYLRLRRVRGSTASRAS